MLPITIPKLRRQVSRLNPFQIAIVMQDFRIVCLAFELDGHFSWKHLAYLSNQFPLLWDYESDFVMLSPVV